MEKIKKKKRKKIIKYIQDSSSYAFMHYYSIIIKTVH